MEFISIDSGSTVKLREIKAYKSVVKYPHYVYLMAGVHGDEPEGVYLLDKLFSWLKSADLELALVVIPRLNIDGLDIDTRLNANGVDLNRNLPSNDWSPQFQQDKYHPGSEPLSEPENKYLVSLMDKYHPKLIISFHSWKPILNVNGDCLEVANLLKNHNNYPIQDDIGYPTPGSLGTYAVEVRNCPVLTYELPNKSVKPMDKIWLDNCVGLQQLCKGKLLKC